MLQEAACTYILLHEADVLIVRHSVRAIMISHSLVACQCSPHPACVADRLRSYINTLTGLKLRDAAIDNSPLTVSVMTITLYQ